PVHADQALERRDPRSRRATSAAARRTPHLRDAHAPPERPHRDGRRVVGAHRRLLHAPHLRARPARGIARGGTKPYPLTRQHRGLIRTPDRSWVEPFCKGDKTAMASNATHVRVLQAINTLR